MKKNKTLIIIIAAVVLAGIGFTAGMIAKSSLASNADISLDEAKQIAISSVGVSAEKATFTKEELDDTSYEIDFYTETNKYDFEIDSKTGAIIDREASARTLSVPDEDFSGDTPAANDTTVSNDDQVIGVDAAKDIALNHAGVSSGSFQETYLDYDDGIRVYDIEFTAGDYSYDYEINAITGSILKFDKESLYDDYDDDYDDD